jgi:dihydroorotase (multifunctional complex type)
LPVDLVLCNSKVYVNGKIVEAGIAIDEGKILKIAKETNLPRASRKLDLKRCLILPGLVDCHVHLRDQQLAYKEDFFTGTSTAAAGGVTLVLDMPNNKPVTMDTQSLRERMKLAEKQAIVNIAFYSAFPKNSKEVSAIVKEGAVAFKIFLSQKIGGVNIDDDNALLKAFKMAERSGVPVAVHAEDREMLEEAEKKMRQDRRDDASAYVKVHSPEAGVKAIQRTIRIVEKSSSHVHFCHISSAAELNTLVKAKEKGLPITCETTPHNLLLTFNCLKCCGNLALTNPPLRTKQDVKTLWNALQQGLIDIVASDHAPHTIEEKKAESVWDTKSGIPGLETMLPLLLTQVNEGRLKLSDLVRMSSEKPSQIFHLKDRGGIVEGNWADLTVVDLKQEYKIDSSKFHSKAKYSPFDGHRVKGKPIKTFVNGQLAFNEGNIVAKHGTGQVLR